MTWLRRDLTAAALLLRRVYMLWHRCAWTTRCIISDQFVWSSLAVVAMVSGNLVQCFSSLSDATALAQSAPSRQASQASRKQRRRAGHIWLHLSAMCWAQKELFALHDKSQ
jgi:predicted O-linked N-acetylglucosamine transferase (SPINDLY family)